MSESLRDQLTANLDKIVARDEGAEAVEVETPAATPSGGEGIPPQSQIAEAPKTEDRARDPKTGKFIEKDDKAAAPPAKEPASSPPRQQAKAPEAAAAPVPKPKPQRPQAWKKDFWGHWDKLTTGQNLTPEEALALADYMQAREKEYQQGISTYKKEWDTARPVLEQAQPILAALQPFLPLLQQHGIQPTTWIQNLGTAHRELALGTPQQKLQRFAWLAQQYGVPVAALVNEEAQQQFLASPQQAQPQQLPPNLLTRDEAVRLWQEQFAATTSAQDIERFAADSEKHPHFEALRETMAQLLDAGLAEDLPSAYEAALRHPRHSEIWQAIQEQERASNEEEKRRAEAERLAKAKGKAVSVRSATPGAPAGEKPKDRRSQLEENFDAVVGGGRV